MIDEHEMKGHRMERHEASAPEPRGGQAQERQWDPWQRAALDAARTEDALTILGGPGTGKTAVLEAIVKREADAGSRVAFIVQDRRAAGECLVRISRALGSMSDRVEVRSLSAFAYSVVREFAEQSGQGTPELVSGTDEDALFRELIESGAIAFPESIPPQARSLLAFRQEMRNLVTRAVELGLSASELEELGRREGLPLWSSAAQLRRAYEQRISAPRRENADGGPGESQRLDHAQIVTRARDLLASWEEAAARSNRSAKAVRKPRWDVVVVDDIQNAPRSILGLLRQMHADGARVVAAGDPDSCVQGFRGAVASMPADLALAPPEGIGAAMIALGQSHRGGAKLAEAIRQTAGRIRVAGSAAGRRMEAADGEDSVEACRYVNEEEEAAAIARVLREWHLRDGVPYSQMAVLTRSRAAHGEIRRELVRRSVPVASIGTDTLLARQRAVEGLVAIIRLALEPPEDDEESGRAVQGILAGPYFGLDPLQLRRLRLSLRGIELAGGGSRKADALFAVALEGPEAVDALHPKGLEPLRHLGVVLAAIRAASAESAGRAEQVLWAAWDSAGCADSWRQTALGEGGRAEQANEDLDCMLQLFRFVQRLADRDEATTIGQALVRLEEHELPEDSIARLASREEAVTLTTPAASQGKSYRRVVLARLNEGTWPNLAIRDTLARTSQLSSLVTGRAAAGMSERERFRSEYEEVLDDELRQLHHSLGRAEEKLLVTCLEGEDLAPSRFFRAMGFAFAEEAEEDLQAPLVSLPAPVRPDLDMTGLVGQLRRYTGIEGEQGARARRLLAELADAGVPEAEPALWMEEAEPTTLEPDGSPEVRVSPSQVESLLTCPLRATLQSLGFSDSSQSQKMRLGTIVHAIVERHPQIPEGMDRESFAAALASEFAELVRREELLEDSSWGRRQAEESREAFGRIADFIATRKGNVSTEYRFAVRHGDALLTGSIDRLEIGPQATRIVDYKTGAHAPTDKDAADHVQMQLYQWAIAAEGRHPAPAGAELFYPWIAGPKKTGGLKIAEQQALDDASRARAEGRIEAAARVQRLAGAPARQSKSCDHCDYRNACPLRPEGRIFS